MLAVGLAGLLGAASAARAQTLSFTYEGQAACAAAEFFDTAGLQCIACGDGEVRCSQQPDLAALATKCSSGNRWAHPCCASTHVRHRTPARAGPDRGRQWLQVRARPPQDVRQSRPHRSGSGHLRCVPRRRVARRAPLRHLRRHRGPVPPRRSAARRRVRVRRRRRRPRRHHRARRQRPASAEPRRRARAALRGVPARLAARRGHRGLWRMRVSQRGRRLRAMRVPRERARRRAVHGAGAAGVGGGRAGGQPRRESHRGACDAALGARGGCGALRGARRAPGGGGGGLRGARQPHRVQRPRQPLRTPALRPVRHARLAAAGSCIVLGLAHDASP